MSTPQTGQQIIVALQQYPQNQPAAIESILIAAQEGDPRAQGLAAYWLAQQGRWPEAADWGERADAAGCIFIAWWLGQQLLGQPDPALRSRGAILFSRGLSTPVSQIDPFGPAQQLAQQGTVSEALAVLDAAIGAPAPWRQQIEEAATEAATRVEAVRQAESAATAERDRVVGLLEGMTATAQTELESLKRLGREVGEIAHDRAADFLKKGYEAEAKAVQKRADVATVLSIALAVGIAVAALAVASSLPAEDTLSAALEKAAFSIPLLALNAYIARLATTFREEALRWRHIKLQIQTANPFLGALDEAQRKETLALLATRFFPGQPMPMPPNAAEPSDVSAALASMFQPAGATPKVTVEPVKPPAVPATQP